MTFAKKKKLSERKNFLNKIKINNIINIINYIKNQIILNKKKIIEYIILGIPFILMDFFIREETKKINFGVSLYYSYIFSYTYIIFFVLSSKCFKGNIGKVYYSILFIFYFLLFLTNINFFSFSTTFFQFKILSYAGEGSHYMIEVILGAKKKIWIISLIIICSFILALIMFRKSKKNNFLILIYSFFIFIILQVFTRFLFGPIKGKS